MAIEDLKLKLKEDFPISSIVELYIPLKKNGASFLGLCPFHGDTKPSMHVTDSKKMFKCFACGVGGDAISFVMKYKNFDFIEALKDICDKLSLPWEDYSSEKKKSPKFDMAQKILSKSTQIYQKIANQGSNNTYSDFLKNRKISKEIATTYQLGLAAKNSVLFDYFSSIPDKKQKDFALSIALELGLIKPNQYDNVTSTHYDTFRERIIFPIWDHYGQVIGFTTRVTRDDQKAKYMNSKDSFIFNKGNLLYGLHLAKTKIRENDRVILVEGNMDQITLFANGFQECVAIMGTALGEKSLPHLLSLTKNIYLCLDNDSAGAKASERANELLLKNNIVPKYIDLGPYKDPDDLINQAGRLEFNKRLDEAIPFLDHQLKSLLPTKIPELTDRKLELLNECFKVLMPLGNSLQATERVIQFARSVSLQTGSDELVGFYKDYLAKNNQPKPTQHKSSIPDNTETKELENIDVEQVISSTNTLANTKTASTRPLNSAEKNLIRCLLENTSLLEHDELQNMLALVNHCEVQKYVLNLEKLAMEVDDIEFSKFAFEATQKDEYSQNFKDFIGSCIYSSTETQNVKSDEESKNISTQLVFELKKKLEIENLKMEKKNLMGQQKSILTENDSNQILQKMVLIDKKINNLNNTKFKR